MIEKRSGSWRVRVHVGRDPLTNKKRYKTGTARTKAEARQRLRALREELRDLRRRAREADQLAGTLAREAQAARVRAEQAQAEADRVGRELEAAEQGEKV